MGLAHKYPISSVTPELSETTVSGVIDSTNGLPTDTAADGLETHPCSFHTSTVYEPVSATWALATRRTELVSPAISIPSRRQRYVISLWHRDRARQIFRRIRGTPMHGGQVGSDREPDGVEGRVENDDY